MKTIQLTGKALDWAVAQLEYPNLDNQYIGAPNYSPTTKWEIAGPIIEREMVDIFHQDNGFHGAIERGTRKNPHPTPYFAPTVLEAAMRCYVAKKLGAEIDVPEDMKD